MRRILITFLPLMSVLAACSSSFQNPAPRLLTPYRADIPQGNYLTQDQVSKLKVGMTKEQVNFLLGSPLLTSAFHGDRWDYVFQHRHKNGDVEKRRFIVLFKDDKLVRFEGDQMPTDPISGRRDPAPR